MIFPEATARRWDVGFPPTSTILAVPVGPMWESEGVE